MPSRVGVFTLTRDRLPQTRDTFESMRANRPGHPYDHWVFDNCSSDGTRLWLKAQKDMGRVRHVVELHENLGLHKSMNIAHRVLLSEGYDFILKVDNDLEFKTKHWLRKLIKAHRQLAPKSVLSPKVDNLKYVPTVWARKRLGPYEFAFTEIIGGACRLMPRAAIESFEFNERMPMAWGGDATFANHCVRNTIPMVYCMDVRVRHVMDDESMGRDIPVYMKRKEYESYVPYGV